MPIFTSNDIAELSSLGPDDPILFEIIVLLEPFERYLNLVEPFIESEYTSHKEHFRQMEYYAQTNPDDLLIRNMEASRAIRYKDFERNFPKILRRSLFVSLYAVLESILNNECSSRRKPEILLALSDIRGDGIERAKIYLEKVLKMNFPSRSVEWQEIRNFSKLRNCLVHNSGNLSGLRNRDDAEALKRYVLSRLQLQIEVDEILLERGFCYEALNIIGRFLYKLKTAQDN